MRVFLSVGVLLLTTLLTSCATTAPRPGSAGSALTTASASGPVYASTSFVVPFDVSPPTWVNPKPAEETPNFVTWEAPNAPAVRFLAPATVYRPGEKGHTEIPKDYLSYLLGQKSVGAHFRDQTRGTVGGEPATLVTATTDRSLDGSLGCPAKNTPAAACFGLQPDLELRIAVVQAHGRTLLIWMRTDKSTSRPAVAAKVRSFDDMLASVRFSSRAVQPATPLTNSPLDGTYQMSISWPKTKTETARCVGGKEGTSSLAVYQLILDRGSLQLWVRVGGSTATRELGMADSYRIINHQIAFGGYTAKFTFDGQNLTLSNLQGGQCGDVAIWTTKPWIRR